MAALACPGSTASSGTTRRAGVLNGVDSQALLHARELADEVCASLATIAAGRTVTVGIQGNRARIRADRRLLRSSMANLVSNAIKFTRDGGSVVVRVQRSGTSLSVEVEDECGGLSAEAVERIATPWLQLGADRSGFGLGVAIAKRAAEAHGGTLDARDIAGKGCVFRLELPTRREVAQLNEQVPRVPTVPAPPGFTSE